MYLKHLLVFIAILLFSGCIDSGSADRQSVTGQFIDDPIEGLTYTCSSGTTGITNSNGEYTCYEGDDVLFSLNGVSLGQSVSVQVAPITPYSVFPSNNDAALNLAILLQSINTTPNTNLIKVDPNLVVKIPIDTDFTSSSFETTTQSSLGVTFVSAYEAQNAMNSAISSVGGSIPSNLNHVPVADAGSDLSVSTFSNVTLNGSNSSDADSDTLTYLWSISSAPSSSVATISNPTSSEPIFTPDKDGVYIINLVVNDGEFSSSVNSVKITASTPENVPTISNFSGSVIENSSVGTSIGTINIVSSGDSAITAITLSGTGSSNFEVSTTGAITVKSGATLDYETTTSYSLSAVAVNSAGNSNTVDVTILVTDVLDITPILESTTASVAENSSAGASVGNINITSSGDSAITAITLSGTGSSNFEVSTAGAITVKSGATLDYETTTSYSLSAVATNSAGDSVSVSVMISITDALDIPPVLTSATLSVDENASVGTLVGNLTISSSGDSNISSITLSGDGSDNFEISTAGAITVKSGATLDYETTTSYALSAVATNIWGSSNSVSVNISVNNIADNVPTLSSFSGSIAERSATAASVGSITISSVGSSAITAITLSGTGSSNFEVSTAGAITVKAGASLDYETKTSYSLTATATNKWGDSSGVSVSISVTDISDIVPSIEDFTGSVSESASSGASVGTITVTSIGSSAITAITLSGTGSSNFEVSTAGSITVKSGASLDYETTQTYDLTAVATNVWGDSTSVDVTISVLNTLEVPTLADTTLSIDENASIADIVGTLSITSAGDSNISAITLSGVGDGNFSVSTSGVVSVSATASLDYETKQDYNLTAVATNLAGNSTSVNLNISVNDILDTATFYIKSAVYDNNATSSVSDDKLYIYFDQSIDSSSIDSNMSANYTIEGAAIGSGSLSDYNDTLFHRHLISLNNLGSASSAFSVNDTNISISSSVLTDTYSNNTIYDANKTQAEKFRVILKTGQTTSYVSNDDGDYENGRARSYTDDLNGTITDNVTGLIWQKEDDNTTKSYTNADTYCTSLNLGGSTSWRLPSVMELVGLSDFASVNPSIDSNFTSTELYHYWSSTAFNSNSAYAHTVDFRDGTISSLPKTDTVFVRCVRDGL